MGRAVLASEEVDQFFVDGEHGRDRLEFTSYGTGDAWVVLLPPLLVPRTVHDRTARALAASGLHVLTLDPLGHGRSDRPADPLAYSVSVFADQVVALLDHVGATRAVIGGSAVGANVALEVAVRAPQRVAGLLLDAPALDNALAAQLALLGPGMYAARFAPLLVTAARWGTRPLPARVLPQTLRLTRDVLDQRPGPMAALLHGVLFGRLAPSAAERREIATPTLVLARPLDVLHPAADAELVAGEISGAQLERAQVAGEWRRIPERLDIIAARFARQCVHPGHRTGIAPVRRVRRSRQP
ncbi:MAG: alpha/beta hydrolase [Nocardioidaceae bacterium]|nr:alpha/beta hydrolase [Nocardioidaceae bacterium]